MFSRKIVKCQQRFMVFLETLCGLGIFGAVNTDKIIKVALGLVFFGGLLNLMQLGFGLWL